MKFRLLSGIIIFSSLFFVAPTSHAQIPSLGDYSSLGGSSLGNYSELNETITSTGPSISLSSAPEFPQPRQTTKIYIQDSSAQYTSTPITWVVNGKQYASGIGKTSIEIIPGDSGSRTTVTAILSPSNSSSISKSLVIRPTYVDMVWQAQSYTPPFYQGKALLAYQGSVTVMAVPTFYNGSTLLQGSGLIYTWKLNDRVLGSLSGYGKNTLELTSDIIQQTMDVTVTVATMDGSVRGQGRVIIAPQAPAIVVYENNPLYGTLYNQMLSSQITLKNPEIGLTASPFYFSNNSIHALPASYLVWSINSQESVVSNTLTLRKPSSGSGSTNISITSRGAGELLQNSTANMVINFTNK